MILKGVTWEDGTVYFDFIIHGVIYKANSLYRNTTEITVQLVDPFMDHALYSLAFSALQLMAQNGKGYAKILNDLCKTYDSQHKEADIVDSTARDITDIRQLDAGRTD